MAAPAQALCAALRDVEYAEFAGALENELKRQALALAEGIGRYREHGYRRALADPPSIWHDGTTRLRDYGPEGGVPVLVVPSLINRAYILDLAPDRSLLRYLSAAGLRPFLVDWDCPGEVERGFGLTEYVAGRLDQAFDIVLDRAGGPVAVVGYCMGGLLALAFALRRQRDVAGLAVLATPWNFHVFSPSLAPMAAAMAPALETACSAFGEVPTDILQALFFLGDPLLSLRKFTQFAAIDPASRAALEFVALEDWANDGVALALPAARECFAGWYGRNDPAGRRWRIAGRVVDAAQFTRPALVMVPTRDRLVPAASAAPLGEALPNAETTRLATGHVGLVAGARAPAETWPILRDRLLAWHHGADRGTRLSSS